MWIPNDEKHTRPNPSIHFAYRRYCRLTNVGRVWRCVGLSQLEPDSTLRDVVMVVRADEACHSHVNHTMSSLDADEQNPFRPCTPVLPPVRGLAAQCMPSPPPSGQCAAVSVRLTRAWVWGWTGEL